MDESALDRIPAWNRVSIRAVLVRDGEDPGPALAAAGIFDPVAIPVVLGDDPGAGGGILGDGMTPNLTGVIEFDAVEDTEASPADTDLQGDAAAPAGRLARSAPAAFGFRSFAPVGRTGAVGSRPGGSPTVPSSLQAGATVKP